MTCDNYASITYTLIEYRVDSKIPPKRHVLGGHFKKTSTAFLSLSTESIIQPFSNCGQAVHAIILRQFPTQWWSSRLTTPDIIYCWTRRRYSLFAEQSKFPDGTADFRIPRRQLSVECERWPSCDSNCVPVCPVIHLPKFVWSRM